MMRGRREGGGGCNLEKKCDNSSNEISKNKGEKRRKKKIMKKWEMGCLNSYTPDTPSPQSHEQCPLTGIILTSFLTNNLKSKNYNNYITKMLTSCLTSFGFLVTVVLVLPLPAGSHYLCGRLLRGQLTVHYGHLVQKHVRSWKRCYVC